MKYRRWINRRTSIRYLEVARKGLDLDCVLKEMKRKANYCIVLGDSEQNDVSANVVLSLNLGSLS
jgi:hypothetical protein